MEKIDSKSSNKIKELRKLDTKKNRNEAKKFLVENAVIIRDGLQDNFDPKRIFVTEAFQDKEIFEKIRQKSQAEVFLINEEINKSFSALDTPAGITALYDIKDIDIDRTKPSIYLNSIKDPGNLGTIIRTMLAFGFENLIVDEECCDIYNPKTIQAAKDCIFKIKVLRDKNYQYLKDSKTPIYASHVEDGQDIDSFKIDDNYTLVMGSESHGVAKEILDIAHKKINIKLSNDTESLNVAIATAIILYKFRK